MTSKDHVIKVLVVGDPGAGKTSLARTVTEGGFPTADSLPQNTEDAACSVYSCKRETVVRVDDKTYSFHIYDSSSEVTVRETISKVDFCYVCFDITNPETFNNVRQKWWPFVKGGKRKAKLILVGLKQDISHDSQGPQATCYDTANKLASDIGACYYVEVSALKFLGVQELKEKTVFEFIQPQMAENAPGRKRCSLM